MISLSVVLFNVSFTKVLKPHRLNKSLETYFLFKLPVPGCGRPLGTDPGPIPEKDDNPEPPLPPAPPAPVAAAAVAAVATTAAVAATASNIAVPTRNWLVLNVVATKA